jgi:ankyrin repeat protein
LITASENGHVQVVKALLERGADIRMATDNGSTARSVATDPEIVSMLQASQAQTLEA